MATATRQNKYHHFLGIDVSKDTIDCLLRPNGAYSQWTNRDEGFQRLHQWLESQHCEQSHTLICIEDTGIYSDRLLAGLTDRGWQCAVVKTTATKKVAPEHHRKEDRFDAGLLAEYGQRYVDRIYLDPAAQTSCSSSTPNSTDTTNCCEVFPAWVRLPHGSG